MSISKKVAFYTLGCKVNQYETEIIRKDFLENGFSEVEFDEKADVYAIDETFDTIDQMFESKIAKEMFEMYTNEIANKKREPSLGLARKLVEFSKRKVRYEDLLSGDGQEQGQLEKNETGK